MCLTLGLASSGAAIFHKMATEDSVAGAVAGILSGLAKGVDHSSPPSGTNGVQPPIVELPGPDSISKTTLEQELTALAARIHSLEIKANGRSSFSASSDEPRSPSLSGSSGRYDAPTRRKSHLRNKSAPKEMQNAWVTNLLSTTIGDQGGDESTPKVVHLSEDQADLLKEHMFQQDRKIKSQHETLEAVETQLKQQKKDSDRITTHGFPEIDAIKRELAKHQQANMAFQKALREIGNIVTAVAAGDLSKKVLIHAKELDPEITTFKKTINTMVDQLQDFASQVTFIAKEVGTEGRLGGQAALPEVSGIWAELTGNVNIMADNLTKQVREIAAVTTAVANGDLSRKIESPAKGEILQLQQTINTMVDQLRMFATEVTRVARDVGTEGVLGGQAQIEGVKGMWNDLTINVNAMANNLTTQVRDIAKVTTAVAKGDLTQKVTAQCKGEILDLKSTINSMVSQLQQFAHEVTNLALEVGTKGQLGGQAKVYGVEGTWRDLTTNVNVMAMKLTTQVREIAEVTTAVAEGDLTRKVTADVKGEVLALKITINSMVDRLGTFAFEVSKVAREVGTDGALGGQAKVENVEGRWKDLTENVNTMAQVSSFRMPCFCRAILTLPL